MSAIDLTDLGAVRAQLQRLDDTETEQDDVLQALITAYSRHIVRKYREFRPLKAGATRMVEIDPELCLHSLAPFDARSVTSVVLDAGKDTEMTLDSSSWTLAHLDAENDVWQSIELLTPITCWARRGRTLTLTGEWGFADVPEDVEQACRLAVVTALRADVQMFGSASQPNSFGDDVNQEVALTPGVRGLLAPFRREVYA